MQSYLAPRSGQTWPLDVPRWCGDAREALMLTERRGIGRAEIATGTRSIWRYAAALPFLPAAPISMDIISGWLTPMVRPRNAATTASNVNEGSSGVTATLTTERPALTISTHMGAA